MRTIAHSPAKALGVQGRELLGELSPLSPWLSVGTGTVPAGWPAETRRWPPGSGEQGHGNGKGVSALGMRGRLRQVRRGATLFRPLLALHMLSPSPP